MNVENFDPNNGVQIGDVVLDGANEVSTSFLNDKAVQIVLEEAEVEEPGLMGVPITNAGLMAWENGTGMSFTAYNQHCYGIENITRKANTIVDELVADPQVELTNLTCAGIASSKDTTTLIAQRQTLDNTKLSAFTSMAKMCDHSCDRHGEKFLLNDDEDKENAQEPVQKPAVVETKPAPALLEAIGSGNQQDFSATFVSKHNQGYLARRNVV